MDNIYVIRERIEAVYGKHSKSFDKAFQFILAMITFTMINQNTGFMKSLSSPVISLGLAVVATFLPPAVLVVLATILLLAHTLAASIGIFAVSALIFLIMYIFYIRLAPKMAFVVLLTPIAFALKIPFVVPVACALIYTPVSLVPMGCGTVVYYMMEYLKKISAASKTSGSKAMLAEISTYVQKVFQNKEMWLYIVAFIIGFFIIYTIPQTGTGSCLEDWDYCGSNCQCGRNGNGKYCTGRKHLLWSADHRKYCGSRCRTCAGIISVLGRLCKK